jgi:hypothetical protein
VEPYVEPSGCYAPCMPPTGSTRRKRPRGEIETLPSGSLRLRVYAGIDPISGKKHHVVEVIPAGKDGRGRPDHGRDQPPHVGPVGLPDQHLGRPQPFSAALDDRHADHERIRAALPATRRPPAPKWSTTSSAPSTSFARRQTPRVRTANGPPAARFFQSRANLAVMRPKGLEVVTF